MAQSLANHATEPQSKDASLVVMTGMVAPAAAMVLKKSGGERAAAQEVPAQSHPRRGVRTVLHGTGADRSEGAAGEHDQQCCFEFINET